MGSQIPSAAAVEEGVAEAAQIYCELAATGAAMRVMDVGGGLAVDYDGAGSRPPSGTSSSSSGASPSGASTPSLSGMSAGYTWDEYAAAVVGPVMAACDARGIAHPVLCSESGRALVSHHSVLVFDVISSSSLSSSDLALASAAGCHDSSPDGGRNAVYRINLSIFRSMPDTWAIGQLFPILPLQRLHEEPTVRAVLSDITCDSDGKLAAFVCNGNGNGATSTCLRVHPLDGGKGPSYYLGMFLGGAYQEALGGMHNLFGAPDSVQVVATANGGFSISIARSGDAIADVLARMDYDPSAMIERLGRRIRKCSLDFPDGGDHMAGLVRTSFAASPYLYPRRLR